MVRALQSHLADVIFTDIIDHGFPKVLLADFLVSTHMGTCDGIITNPPYGPRGATAGAFIRHGLRLIAKRGFLALLLPVDFDNAKTRADCFGECPAYAAKISLTKRIKWFDLPPAPGEKSQGPTENHAWFIWESTALPFRQCARQLYAPTIKGKDDDHQ
jgi:hypothetical protein